MKTTQGYFRDSRSAINAFTRELNEQLAQQIKALFEGKHLYQKVTVDPAQIEKEIMKHVANPDLVLPEIQKIRRNRLVPNSSSNSVLIPVGGGSEIVVATLLLPNVRLFCTKCDERNVFAAIWYQDLSNELLRPRSDAVFETTADIFSNQLFFVALQCQHCKGLPEGFLIRREGWRFSLDGRSPIEHVSLPAYIPRDEANLFRDALIARFTGKHLAATFYLRAFIEQFARRLTGLKGQRKTGDEIMDAYAQKLPLDRRRMLPSLKEWYDKLSEPLHAADEEAADNLFDQARAEIESHFDIRRALKIPEV